MGWLILSRTTRFALGAGGGHQLMMAVVSASALVALVWWTARRPARIDGWPIGLVVGGGAANITDRIVQGQAGVTDFLDTANVIVINLADVAVLTGICAGALMLLRSHRRNIPHPHRENRGRHRGGSALQRPEYETAPCASSDSANAAASLSVASPGFLATAKLPPGQVYDEGFAIGG